MGFLSLCIIFVSIYRQIFIQFATLQMAETGAEGKPIRNRRNITRKNREDIYCYELPQHQLEQPNSQQNYDELKSGEEIPADDDSFSYKDSRVKKPFDQRKKGGKQKSPRLPSVKKVQRKKVEENPQAKGKKQSSSTPKAMVEYYPTGSSKQVKDIKIFNPVLYEENIFLKNRYQKQLEDIYKEYGRKIGKSEEPSIPANSWNFLLKQVEEVGKDFASEREERVKLKRKLAKFSQSFYNRIEQIKQQRIKDEQKLMRRQSLELMRTVKRKFWGSCMKVRRIIKQQEKKKVDKQEKMKKLQDLVARQFEASQKITKVLEGYQEISLDHIEVSQTTKVPVIINIDRKPKYKYAGLHEDNIIRPSLLIKFPLREYQLLGVYWIYTLHNRGLNAILADEMGLGKTIQTIALLAHLAIQKGVWGPHLVIVPTTILMNWEIQFKRWCPAFKIMTYFGSPKERKAKRKGWSKLNSFHVCITSYKIAVTDHPIFRRKKWYYMVLDEAQNIKNFKSQRWQILLNFKTKHRLLLTGTPLQNDLTQLWSLLHFLMPKVFNSFDDFNEWFNLPFQEALQKNFPISQQILKKLHTVLRPFFLRRLKKDVETQLPKKTQSIVRCGMSRRQKYLYDEMIWHQNKRFKTTQSAGMMNVLMGLKKICNHPDLFQPRIEETPLNLSPLTIVIAHHMFLKSHFETYKTHILRDFVDNFSVDFTQIANDILQQYDKLDINEDNELYYRYKYIDRLEFAKVNFTRSKRKSFTPYSFDLHKLEIIESNVPFFLDKTLSQRAEEFEPIFDRFLFVVPRVMVSPAVLATFPMSSEVQSELNRLDYLRNWARKIIPIQLERIRARFLLHFPNKTIILYDSGKLIKMIFLLKSIKYRGQKALVFTQMTKMLDIFEKVLNMFKFNYVRLDGSTKTELRQTIVERFNNDPRILCFISSTRSGGIGLNLTGASNVIFYDTDWNPAMDKQAQDRCHRIGQTRNVTIYRLITEYSIEENILMKSIHKRKLESLVTEEGMFDTSYFQKVSLKGLLKGAIDYGQQHDQQADLAEVEDQEDRALLQAAEKQGKQTMNRDDEQQQLEVDMLPKLFNYGVKMLDNAEQIYEGGGSSDEGIIEEEGQEEDQQEQQAAVSDLQEQNGKQKSVQKNREKQKKVQSLRNRQQPAKQIQKRRGSLRSSRHPKAEQKNEEMLDQNASKNPEIFQQQEQEEEEEEIKKSPRRGMMEEGKPSNENYEQEQEDENVMPQTNPNQQQFKISTLDKLKAMAIYQRQYLFMKKHVYEVQEQEQQAVEAEAGNEVIKAKNQKSRSRNGNTSRSRKRRR